MTEKEENGQCQLPKESGNGENGDSHSFNRYACACVLASTIISGTFGYGECLILISSHIIANVITMVLHFWILLLLDFIN